MRVCIRCTECDAHLDLHSRQILDGLYGQDIDNSGQRRRKSPLHIIIRKLTISVNEAVNVVVRLLVRLREF